MNDERAAEGLDHLQAAALEMIQAARAFLDVAEDLVADRDKVAEVVHAFGTVADVATRAARAKGVHDAGGKHDDDHGENGVHHIRVSS